MTRVIFFQVRDSPSKLKLLFDTAQLHFAKKEHVLICVENEKAQQFANDLLWQEGFLPHLATDEPTTDFIAITKTKQNINQSLIAFNLCPTPLLINTPLRLIYEFEDLSSAHKNQLSSLRFDAYKKRGFTITSNSSTTT
jgi:DNA polymerase-3 subunit chi